MAMSPVVDLHVAVMDVVPLIRSRNGGWTPDTDATVECRSADRERQQICDRILQSRQKAEELWLSQSHSYVYMQHSRKAGGTSLCMALRLNAFGLIQLHKKDHQSTPRETCQIEEFCSDCDIKRKPWYSIGALPDKLMQVMDGHERNFIEIEGSGVPINMLDDSSWGNFVFVSTLRDPIDRIVSLLFYDQCHKDREKCFTKRKASFVKDTKKRCAEKIYDCASNYYVRMFSGLDNKFTNDTHMLLTAKMNFLRFSCVVLLEYWDRTSICLQRLGMYLKDSDVAFNMQGNLDTMSSTNPKADYSHMNMLSEEELRVMRSVNEVDIEFYQWAKQQLLLVASSQRCTERAEGTYN